MQKYERPVVLASYRIEELMQEAVVCMAYGRGRGGGVGGGRGSGKGRGKGRGRWLGLWGS